MTMTATKAHLPDRGVTLNVRLQKGDDDASDPVLLLHGWPISSATWEAVVAQMPTHRTYLCPDLRGLGESERAGQTASFEKHALTQDIAALLGHLGVERYVAVGNDWGGVIAQELALAQPDRVSKLAILNIHVITHAAGNLAGAKAQAALPIDPRWYMTFQSIPGLAEAMIPGNERIWIESLTSHTASGNQVPASLIDDYVHAYSLPGTAHSGASYYRAMRNDLKRWFSLSGQKIRVPTLLLYGTEDPFILPDFYDGVEACFDDFVRVDLHAGHFVQDEKPDEVAAELARFVEP